MEQRAAKVLKMGIGCRKGAVNVLLLAEKGRLKKEEGVFGVMCVFVFTDRVFSLAGPLLPPAKNSVRF